jgi:hypothetical protein
MVGNGDMPNPDEARYEEELQDFIRDHPERFPVEKFDLRGPLLVVGRETRVTSGSIDLLGVTRSGDIVIVEFKTGLNNQNFRRVLAQVLDYGADLSRFSVESFEAKALRYFRNRHCAPAFRGVTSLERAFSRAWEPSNRNDFSAFTDRLGHILSSGSFHFVVVAQRFTPVVNRTTDYLNTLNPNVRFYLVQMVREQVAGVRDYKIRVTRKPLTRTLTQQSMYIGRFLARVNDERLRDRYNKLFAVAAGLGLILGWGSVGMSIRLLRAGGTISVAWVYPPDANDIDVDPNPQGFTFGYYLREARAVPSARRALARYVEAASRLNGAQEATRIDERTGESVVGCKFEPDIFGAVTSQVLRLLADLNNETLGL